MLDRCSIDASIHSVQGHAMPCNLMQWKRSSAEATLYSSFRAFGTPVKLAESMVLRCGVGASSRKFVQGMNLTLSNMDGFTELPN